MTERQVVRDEGNAYFTMVPNMLDDSELDPYAFRLYVHYKRICGANNYRPCAEGLRQTAAACRMSKSQVARAREELAAGGWVRVEKCLSAGQEVASVTVVDRMLENVQRYAKPPVPVRDTPTEPVPDRDTPSPVGTPPSLPGTPPSLPGTPPSLPGTPPVPPGDTHKNSVSKNKEPKELPVPPPGRPQAVATPDEPGAAECADCERAVNRYGQGHQAGCRREHARPQDRWFVARTASAGADVGHSPVGESPGTARPGARAVA